MRKISLLILACWFFVSPACNQEDDNSKLPGYDLNRPEKFTMPETLLEISGIGFINGSSDTVYAIQDEEGKLFRLPWGVKKQYHAKFGKSGDYEDVSFLKGMAIVLKSNGALSVFRAADAIYTEVDSVQEYKGILPKGEYESMYGDEKSGRLYVLCKNCDNDDNKDKVTGYILGLEESVSMIGNFQIDVNTIKSFTGKVKRGFRPSAMARNPLTGEWFIVSAVNKLLVVADTNWKITGAYPLDGNRFYQPEGIAFDKSGNLYISNEGDDISEGNILKFVRK